MRKKTKLFMIPFVLLFFGFTVILVAFRRAFISNKAIVIKEILMHRIKKRAC